MPDVADLRVKISLDGAEKVASGLKSADASVQGFASNAGRLGGAVSSVAAQLATFGIAAGGVVAAGLGAAVAKAADFEAGMSRVKAASGASASEMAALGAAAIALGADTELAGIGATDAAKAMEALAKGGVSVEQQLGGATKGALLLASSGSIDVATAAGIATKAMNIFDLSGAKVAHVADLMSAGANKSATDVGQLSQAFNQSAAVAKNAGLSIEDLTGTLAFFAQRGLEGSDAGTSLKTALLALQAPTDVAAKVMEQYGINVRDAEGHMLPMADIADVLKDRLSGLSDAQRDAALKTLFGNDAIRIGIGLYEGGGAAIRDWTAKVNDAGNAARTGATINDNLKGSVSQLGAVLETGAIQFGSKLTPIVRTATDEVAKFLQQIMDSPRAQAAFDQFATTASTALTNFFTKIKDPAFQNAAKEWATAALDVGRAVVGLAQDIGSVLGPPLKEAVTWFNGLDEAGKKNVIGFALVAASAIKFRDELGTLKTVVTDVVSAFGAKLAAKKLLTDQNSKLATSAGNTAKALTGTGTAAGSAALVVADLAVAIALPVAGAVVMTTGFAALANQMDQTGQRAKDFSGTQQAVAIAQANGATETNNLIDGYMRYLSASGLLNASVSAQSDAWNRYVSGLQGAMFNLDGVTKVGTGTTQAMIPFSAAMQAAGYELGNAGNKGSEFNTNLVGLSTSATMLASTMPTMTTSLTAGAGAIDDMATRSQSLGAGLGSAAISLGAVSQVIAASTAPAATFNAQLAAFEATIRNYSQAAAIATGDTGEFGTAMGVASSNISGYGQGLQQVNGRMQNTSAEAQGLQGYLGVLQSRWNELNVATDNGKNVTAAQAAEYAKLAPSIEYLNGRMGVLNDTQVDSAIKATANYQGLVNSSEAYGKAAASADQASASFTESANSTRVAEIAAIGASNKYNELGQVMTEIPPTVTANITTNAPQAVTDFQGVQTAVTTIPPSVAAMVATNAPEAASGFVGLLGSIGDVPANTPADVTTNAPAATGNFFTLTGAIDNTPRSVFVASDATSAIVAAGQVAGISAAIALVPRSFTITPVVNIGPALAAIATLAANMPHSPAEQGPFRVLPNWDALMESLPGAIQTGTTLLARGLGTMRDAITSTMDAAQADLASKVASAVSAVAKAATDTMSALASIASFDFAKNSPSGEVLGWLSHLVTSLVATIEQAARQFSEEGLKAAQTFADAIGKIGGGIKGALDGLTALGTANWANASPTGETLGWFAHLVASLVETMRTVGAQFDAEGLKAATAFTETIGKVGASIKSAVEGLTALGTANWADASPTGSAMGWFAHLVRSLILTMAESARLVGTEALATATLFATNTGQIFGAIKTAMQTLTDLAKFKDDPSHAFDLLLGGMQDAIDKAQGMVQYAKNLKSEAEEYVANMEAAAALFAKGMAAGGASPSGTPAAVALHSGMVIGNAVAAGTRAALEIHSPSQVMAAIGADAVSGLAQGIQGTQAAAVKAAADAASAVAKAVLDMLGALGGLEHYRQPDTSVIDAFMGATAYIVRGAAYSAAQLGSAGVAAAGAWGEAAGKIVAAIAPGVQSLLALESYRQPVTSTIDAFLGAVAYIVRGAAYSAAQLGSEGVTAAAAFAESAGRVGGMIAGSVAGLLALHDFQAPATRELDAFADMLRELMQRIVEIAVRFEADGLAAAARFADAAGKVTAIIGSGVAGLSALHGFVTPARGEIAFFAASVDALMGDLVAVALRFESVGLDAAGRFAEGAAKVLSLLSGAASLAGLRDFAAPGTAALHFFAQSVRDAVDFFVQHTWWMAGEAVAAAARWAESAGKILGLLSSATGLADIAKFAAPPVSALHFFAQAMRDAVQLFIDHTWWMSGEGVAAAGRWAESAGKILGLLSAATGLADLAKFAAPPISALHFFAQSARDAVSFFIDHTWWMADEGVAAAARWAESAGKILSLLSSAGGLSGLRDFIAPATREIDAFAAASAHLVWRIGEVARGFEVEGVERAGRFATAAAAVLGIVGNGVQGLMALLSFVAPPRDAMDRFAVAVRDMVARMASMAATLATEGTDAAAAFATAVGAVFDGLNSAVSYFKALDGILLPDRAGIDRLLAPIADTLAAVGALEGRIGTGVLDAAARGSAAIGATFAALDGANRTLAAPVGGGGGGGGGGGAVTYVFNFYSDVADRAQVHDWVVAAVTEAQRRGRL